MQSLPLVILEHTATQGRHYDLLLLDPTTPPASSHRLWAARTALPPRQWARAARLDLRPLPHHRQLYLRYQGRIDPHRGRVRRVDSGRAVPTLWTQQRLILDLQLRHFTGRVEITRLSAHCWRMRVFPPADSGLVGQAPKR